MKQTDMASGEIANIFFHIMLVIALVVTLFFAVYDFYYVSADKALVEIVLFVLFSVALFFLHRKLFIRQTMHGAIAVGLLGMLVMMRQDSVVAYWFPLQSIIAFGLLGLRAGVCWAVIASLCFALTLSLNFFSTAPIYTLPMIINVLLSSVVISFIVYFSFKRIEAQYQRLLDERAKRERLETAKSLASGVAHLINNEMQSIVGHAELAKLNTDNEKVLASLNMIAKFGYQTSSHANQLLSFAQSSVHVTQNIDLTNLLETMLEPWRPTLLDDIKLIVEPISFPAQCLGDPVLVAQVILGVLDNAKEAIQQCKAALGQQKVGVIKLILTKQIIQVSKDNDLQAGTYIRLSIEDNGCGIKPSMIPTIFEPFVTSGFLGRGMGLAAASGIMKKHGGYISVESKFGVGSTFYIWLPCI